MYLQRTMNFQYWELILPNELYKTKTPEEIRLQLLKNLPNGYAYDGFNIEGKIGYMLFLSYAKVLSDFDAWVARKINSLIVNEESDLLLDYWQYFGLSDYISIPESKADQVRIIKLITRTKVGIFNTEDIEELIYDLFGLTISVIRLEADDNNLYPALLPVFLLPSDFNNYTLSITINEEITNENYLPLLLPGLLVSVSQYREIVQNFLNKLININYNIIFE